MAEGTVRRSVACTNPHCGNTLYTRGYSDALQPVWKCTNCFREYPRASRRVKTLRMRALEARIALTKEWAAVEDRLTKYVNSGGASGALLIHSYVFNYHMERLLTIEKPKRFDVAYHTRGAREDLQKAIAFCDSKGV